MKTQRKGMRGRLTIPALVLALALLIVFIAMLPSMNAAIDVGLLSADSITSIILRLLPFIFALVILANVLISDTGSK